MTLWRSNYVHFQTIYDVSTVYVPQTSSIDGLIRPRIVVPPVPCGMGQPWIGQEVEARTEEEKAENTAEKN